MLQYSPKIITDSLVMCLDASNNKSYPTDLPVKNGLLVWLDAADDTTFSYSSGTEVSQWRDKSGNNLHANQATTANQPSRSTVVNSRKSVNFTSTNGDFIRIPSGVVFSKYFTAVVLIKPGTQSADYAVILDQDHSTTGYQGWVIQRGSTTSFWQTWVANSSATNWTNANQIAYVDNTSQIVTLRKSSSTLALYSNGTSSGDVSIDDYNLPQAGLYGLNIGYWSAGGGRYYNGNICEILIYNRDLTTTELKQVHTYLGQKWGISNTDRSIIDLSGNNNHGLLGNGTVAYMPDYNYYNKSLTYNKGQSDTLVVTNSTSLKNNNTTIELYMKFNSAIASNTGDYIQFGVGSGNYAQYYFRNESPNLTWNWYVATPAGSSTPYAISNFSTDIYYLITLTGYSSGATEIYVNGSKVASSANTGASATTWTPNNLTIGGYVWDGYSNSDIALTRIYSRVLSAAEISQNYEAIKSRFANTIVQQGLVLNLDAGNPYSYAGAGTTFYDVSATALSWTINNATYNSSDPKYFSYNGSNSWLESSTSAAYDSQTITMECWCYPNSLNQYGFLFEKGAVNSQYSMFLNQGNVFYFRTIGGTINNQDLSFTTTTYLTVNAWNHIACTYNGSSKVIYVNGVQIATVAASGTLNTGQINQYIGKYGAAGNNYPFNGRIAESRVYNIALSAAQVLQNYNATKGKFGL